MSSERWQAVDRYIEDHLIGADPVLEDVLARSAAAGLPQIHVSAAQGKLLQLLAQIQGARTILEIGTLAGYSTLWLARALEDGGSLITLEAEAKHAEVARASFVAAGLADRIELRLGRAVDALAGLEAEGRGPFDLIFIDADKESFTDYLSASIRLSRPGTLIVCDNVVRRGAVLDGDDADPVVRGVRALYAQLASDPRVDATAIQTVGAKGYDGFALVRVTSVTTSA